MLTDRAGYTSGFVHNIYQSKKKKKKKKRKEKEKEKESGS